MLASRYAGAMLLHAFFARACVDSALPVSGDRRPADLALLTAVSMCFALGADTIEQFKHLAAADAGPLAGLGVLPGLRTMRTTLPGSLTRPTGRGAGDVRVRDAGRGPGDARRLLRR